MICFKSTKEIYTTTIRLWLRILVSVPAAIISSIKFISAAFVSQLSTMYDFIVHLCYLDHSRTINIDILCKQLCTSVADQCIFLYSSEDFSVHPLPDSYHLRKMRRLLKNRWRHAEDLAATLPNARSERFAGAGHNDELLTTGRGWAALTALLAEATAGRAR